MLNIQGNIIPFLRDELSLSYRAVGLHPSAIAAGMIVAGFSTERVLAALGRRRALQVAVGGSMAGMVLLGLAPSVVVSVGACLLIGLTGAMIPGIIAGLLAQMHGPTRDQAYGECGAVTYACAMSGTLAVGASVALGLGWRGGLAAGVACGLLLLLTLGRRPVPELLPRSARAIAAPLPAACVAYLVTLSFGVALEFAVLLWCPAYLEHVVGLTPSLAATAAAAYSAAMLLGRWAGSVAVRAWPPPLLLPAALALVVPGFALYWGVATPVAAVAGLFLLGLVGVADVSAVARPDHYRRRTGHRPRRRAQRACAAGAALLLCPLALGALADAVGLSSAHLAIPAIAVAIVLSFTAARTLQRRAVYAAAAAMHD